MRLRTKLICAVLLMSCLVATAKKKKPILPADIVQAKTAWVIIDPQVGVDPKDPAANNRAREAVEAALAKWGRLQPVTSAEQADIIIVIRKGTGKLVDSTIAGSPINTPPPAIGQRTDTGVNASASGRSGGPPPFASDPRPQMEAGDADDDFAVYRGSRMRDSGNPLDAPPVWRISAPNVLAGPDVRAVDAYRKAVLESEKQLANPTP